MKVSIITPFYKGGRYMKGYQHMMEAVEGYTAAHPAADGEKDTVEVILVNDSPEVPIPLTGINGHKSTWHVLKNEKNMGIHYSRLHGLSAATGDYIIFLDQDDFLREDAVSRFLEAARKDAAGEGTTRSGRIFISNAVFVRSGKGENLYRTKAGKDLVWDFPTYVNVGTQIVSPGQVLLNRMLIPDFWKEHPLEKNGSDDYFLWLLLLAAGIEAVFVDAPLYVHRETDSNLSDDTRVTDASCFEFLDLLQGKEDFPQAYVSRLRSMLTVKDTFRHGDIFEKIGVTVCHPVLLFKNLVYKVKTGTPYGYRR